jgi:hypothetical protein
MQWCFQSNLCNAIDEELINEGVLSNSKVTAQRIMVAVFEIQYHYFNPIKCWDNAEALVRAEIYSLT